MKGDVGWIALHDGEPIAGAWTKENARRLARGTFIQIGRTHSLKELEVRQIPFLGAPPEPGGTRADPGGTARSGRNN